MKSKGARRSESPVETDRGSSPPFSSSPHFHDVSDHPSGKTVVPMKKTIFCFAIGAIVSTASFCFFATRRNARPTGPLPEPAFRTIDVGGSFWESPSSIFGESRTNGIMTRMDPKDAERAFSGTLLDHCWDWLQPISAESDGRHVRISLPRLINRDGKMVRDGSETVDVWIDLSSKSFVSPPGESPVLPSESELMQIIRSFDPGRAYAGEQPPDIEMSPAISVVTTPFVPPYDPESPDWVGPDFNMRYWIDNRTRTVMFCLDGGD